ncbi:MAG: hypothetical protein KBH29_05860 [Lutibacter sp.]|nr:hypothetical protein [Lutibacter sp.]
MKYLNCFLVFFLLLVVSCGKTDKTEEVAQTKDSVVVKESKISNSIGETLIPSAKLDIDKWKEYEEVDKFMLKFYSVSKLEALSNAQELADLVKLMKDSIRVRKLDEPSTISRINVLYNETLRLADMANIPSIKKEEVKVEVKKILELFTAFNVKINTIYKAEEVQNALEIDTEVPVELLEQQNDMIEDYRGNYRKKYID